MATKTGGLGRGLGELFQKTDTTASNEVSRAIDSMVGWNAASQKIADGSWFQEISVDKIQPNPEQPRQVFDEDALDELAESVKEVGLLQPIVVRQKGDGYELIMGERRWRAHQKAGLKRIPAIIRATEDNDLLRDALLENLHRVQLNPLEEAAAYQQLLNEFGCTQDELAARVHKSRPHISNTMRLLKLAPAVQRRVASGVLSAGHARALLQLEEAADQERMAKKIVAEGLSVRATEELITLGETGSDKAVRTSRPKENDPEALKAASKLTDVLDTRVAVTRGRNHGRIVIEFADAEDMDRIIGLIVGEQPV
jgi:ParB family chromosome partitioning protein